MQFQSDILGVEVSVPKVTETTALGAAYLAGLATGVYENLEEVASYASAPKRYDPKLSKEDRDELYSGWQKAIEAVKLFK